MLYVRVFYSCVIKTGSVLVVNSVDTTRSILAMCPTGYAICCAIMKNIKKMIFRRFLLMKD